MKRAIALGLLLGGCAALQRREDAQTFMANCTEGAWTDPLCSEIGTRQKWQGTYRPASVPAAAPEETPARGSCCKVCKSSQACGNSCISWSKTCHQPPGCAC
jgi:hypothetical protein